jgi:hypothetical protein
LCRAFCDAGIISALEQFALAKFGGDTSEWTSNIKLIVEVHETVMLNWKRLGRIDLLIYSNTPQLAAGIKLMCNKMVIIAYTINIYSLSTY